MINFFSTPLTIIMIKIYSKFGEIKEIARKDI